MEGKLLKKKEEEEDMEIKEKVNVMGVQQIDEGKKKIMKKIVEKMRKKGEEKIIVV